MLVIKLCLISRLFMQYQQIITFLSDGSLSCSTVGETDQIEEVAMKTSLLHCLAIFLILLGMPDKSFAQHYEDWTGFQFAPGRYDSKNRIVFYELLNDYTISIPDYFLRWQRMPDCCNGEGDFYHSWASNLPSREWDFIRLEPGGILTVKKGYRWDGASLPCKKYDDNYCPDEAHNFRSSLVHDALYDLMRMGYLLPDTHHHLNLSGICLDTHLVWGTGDYNRKMADMMHYMIAMEDGDPKDEAQSDYFWLRVWGACRTHDDDMLAAWKYHVSELTAYASSEKVDLKWQKADKAGKDLEHASHFATNEGYDIFRNNERIGSPVIGKTTYSDTPVANSYQYVYSVKPKPGNTNQDDYSDKDTVIPVDGPGNALIFDGIDDFVEANNVSNDLSDDGYRPDYLSLEAWVYPELQAGNSPVLSFNISSSVWEHMHLMYCASQQKFCYLDDFSPNFPEVEIYSRDEFPPHSWYHVAVTFNKSFSEGILYVNGTKQALFSSPVRPGKGAELSIGRQGPGTGYYKGMIDEARVWNVTRTQEEIKAGMCGPLLGNEAGLVGLWHFDNLDDTTIPIFFDCTTWIPESRCVTHDATANASDGVLLAYGSGYDFVYGGTNHVAPYVPSGAMLPVAVAQDISVILDATGNATITPDQVNAGSSDTFCIDGISADPSSFTCQDIGPNIVTLTVTDINGKFSTDEAIVTVVDNSPPEISDISVSQELLWPPNHKMISVEILGASITDNCGELDLGSCMITAVSNSEEGNDSGAGNTEPDYEITGDLIVDLRAESSGADNGRTYTVTLDCRDASENSSTAVVDIFVPHDRGKNKD